MPLQPQANNVERHFAGEREPPPEAYRSALREVIRNCIYAVDKNPFAVDLCKVALWIEGHEPGMPLTFLDHHIKRGGSLMGVRDLDALYDGTPDDAYKPVSGDDRAAAAGYRNRNRQERNSQLPLRLANADSPIPDLGETYDAFAQMAETRPEHVHAKEARYAELRGRATD